MHVILVITLSSYHLVMILHRLRVIIHTMVHLAHIVVSRIIRISHHHSITMRHAHAMTAAMVTMHTGHGDRNEDHSQT